MKLSDIGEFGFIRRLAQGRRRGPGVVLGIGDDAAAVRPPAGGKLLLVTCDPVIEGIHFDKTATDEQVGWKAMMRNASDLAAMGGTPRWAVVSAALPRGFPLRRALALQRGLDRAARRCGVEIVGGDTARSRAGVQLTVTLLGEVAAGEMVTRAGARPGHALFVTGTLGGSRVLKHRTFVPRVAEGRFLASGGFVSAMMDVSDGLASDLQRLRERSGVGFEVLAGRVPISPALRAARLAPATRLRRALSDGEDYELVFTVPRAKVALLQKAWARKFRLPITEIGVVRPSGFGIRLKGGEPAALRPLNDHFRVGGGISTQRRNPESLRGAQARDAKGRKEGSRG